LLNGSLLLEEVREVLQCHTLPRGKRYHTLAGLVLDQLGQIPGGGEKFALEGYQFEVVSMDGHRISRVRVRQNTASEMTPSVGQTSG
jgi:CBS domain containing-hemolysin-like protein